MPEYLIEDHPDAIPLTAVSLIKRAGEAKGNGMAAEQLDLELRKVFNNQSKRGTSQKPHRSKMINHLQLRDNDKLCAHAEAAETNLFLEKKKTQREVSKIKQRQR